MHNTTSFLGLSKLILLAACLVVIVPSFAASVHGTSATGNDVEVKIIKLADLKYPRRAERLGVEGYVVVGFDLSEEGELIDVRVIESQPRLMFDKSALKFVKGTDFATPEEGGEPVLTRDIKFRVQFKLQR